MCVYVYVGSCKAVVYTAQHLQNMLRLETNIKDSENKTVIPRLLTSFVIVLQSKLMVRGDDLFMGVEFFAELFFTLFW